MSILVTGAGGFIGRAVVRALHRQGVAARAGVRRAPGPDQVLFDLFDRAAVQAALRDVRAVIHCARDDDHARSVQGTRDLLAMAAAAGVRRFVHLSSVAVYGVAEGLVGETTPPAGKLDAYAQGKLASEADCRAAASDQMTVAVVRPALVYGPGSALWTTPYLRRLPSGRWRRLGRGGEGRANLIHVDDVAGFAAFLADRETGPFAIFNANGPDSPTWNAYLDLFADALGVARPTGRQSTSLTAAALRRPFKVIEKRLLGLRPDLAKRPGALGQLFRAMQDDVTLSPSYQELALYRLNAVYAMTAAARIGFEPRIGLPQGLADCVAGGAASAADSAGH